MSAKKFKSQASSSRAVSNTFGSHPGTFGNATLGATQSFGVTAGSLLSFVYEPPDLSALSDPKVVVAFKNLQKKDGTTKAKALEELQAYVGDQGVEDTFLEAWTKLYPRASIDTARQVRRLAHSVHGDICASSGKRIAKYMPLSVGALLAGLQDNDRVVSRAAQSAFQKIFPSDGKQKAVWRFYQRHIIEYCADAVLKETVNTLSDERTTRPDDAESKYACVTGSAILTVANVLDNLTLHELQQCEDIYSDLMRNKILWKSASHVDSFVRRAVYRLIQSCLLKQELNLIDLDLVGKGLLRDALPIDQTGSAFEFSKTLAQLSAIHSNVWTENYSGSGNRSAKKRLCQYLQKGSQGGPPAFWKQISLLIHNIPQVLLQPDAEDTNSDGTPGKKERSIPVLSSIRYAINRKEEPHSNQTEAWRTYLDVAELSIPSDGTQDQFLDNLVSPIIDRYVISGAEGTEGTEWTINGLDREKICIEVALLLLRRSPKVLELTWKRISSAVVERMQASFPAQSKDYRSSQDSVSLIFNTWYSLQASIVKQGVLDKVRDMFVDTSTSECRSAISILRSRNGEPYSAAAGLDFATSLVPETTVENEETKKSLLIFLRSDLQLLLLSPSSTHAINMLSVFQDEPEIQRILASSIKAIIDAADSEAKFRALESLIASPWLGRGEVSEYLQEYVRRSLQAFLEGTGDSWTLVTAAIGNKCIPTKLSDQILARITENLSIKENSHSALRGLDLASRRNEKAFRAFSFSSDGAHLLSRLLFLAEDKDLSLAEEANKLATRIRDILLQEGEVTSAGVSMIEIIRNGIQAADAGSLSIPSLVTEATQLIRLTPESEKSNIIDTLLPGGESWKMAVNPFIYAPIDASLEITNPLGGVLNLIEQGSDVRQGFTAHISRDSNGFSSGLRMSWFVTKLCTDHAINGLVTSAKRAITCQQLALFVTLLSDNISIPRVNGLWISSDNSSDSTPISLFAEVWSLLATWLRDPQSDAMAIRIVQENLLADSQGTSPMAYYSGRAYAAIVSELEDYSTSQVIRTDEVLLKAMKDKSNPVATTAIIASLPDPKKALLICNSLIASLTGFKFSENPTEGLRQLILLNAAFVNLDGEIDVPQPRLVFLVKHLVSQISCVEGTLKLISQIFQVLQWVLRPIREIYGSFWAKIFDALRDNLLALVELETVDLPFAYVSIRFCMFLRTLSGEDSNDDYNDLWVENRQVIAELLVRLMKRQAELPDDRHQPRRVVNERLARAMERLTLDRCRNPEALYPTVLSEAPSLQYLAFFLLHTQIPKDQEEMSVEAALSKESKMQLPEELLSLILTAPEINYTTSNELEWSSQVSLKGYLLSWILVFDHWKNASYKLQSDYAASIKDGTYVKDFLDIAFDFLIDSRRKPVDASGYDIGDYAPSLESITEKDVELAMVHVYYLCLKYLPTLARAWWRDECPRQLQKPVESWTEKYISPTVIRSELATVTVWVPTQDPADQPLDVKVSYANEITASLPLDDQEMSIRITLPATYPLSPVLVDSINRVGIDEKKWRSWLLTTAGVINFSGTSGTLIEGLITWRKNVTGALKGQSECAICYSVVSADRQLPNKRCGTCKNQFHASCLYKWFKSSSSSSCPLCRNAFSYG